MRSSLLMVPGGICAIIYSFLISNLWIPRPTQTSLGEVCVSRDHRLAREICEDSHHIYEAVLYPAGTGRARVLLLEFFSITMDTRRFKTEAVQFFVLYFTISLIRLFLAALRNTQQL